MEERKELPKLKMQEEAFTKDHKPEQHAASSFHVGKLEPGKIHHKYDVRTMMSLKKVVLLSKLRIGPLDPTWVRSIP